MTSSCVDSAFSSLCADAEAARAAGDLSAAAFAYAIAITLLPPSGCEDQLYELRLERAACLHGAGDYGAEAEELSRLDELVAGQYDPARRITVALRRANLLLGGRDAAAAQLVAATALAEARSSGATALEVASLFTLAEAAYALGDFITAGVRATKAVEAAIALGDRRGEASARRILGLALNGAGEDGQAHLRASLELCRTIGDRSGEALTLNAIGISTANRAEARAIFLEGLTVAESTGDRESEALLANNLGLLYLTLGLYAQARTFAGRAVRLARALGAPEMLAACLEALGQAYSGLGQFAHARTALREAYALADSLGSQGTAAIALICLARVALADGHPAEAASDLDRAAALCAAIDAHTNEGVALAWRAAAHLRAGEVAAAREATARAVDLIAGGGGDFPLQEVWWHRYRALAAPEPTALDVRSPEALAALARARDTMYEAIATLSDSGLRRSYLGRAGVNRAIIKAMAETMDQSALGPPTAPPLSKGGLQDQMARLLGITARLNNLRDAAALRETFLDELTELCGAERLLLLLGSSLETPDGVLVRGVPSEQLEPLRLWAMPLLREAMRGRRALISESPGAPEAQSPPALRPRSAIAVPLISGARLVGAFYADVQAFFGPFTAADLDPICLLAAQAATAIENARLYAQTLRAKEDLEQQVAERTADLQAANQALSARAAEAQAARAAAEAASAAKSVFLANISHELRTPLNAVIGFAQVLLRDQSLSERQRELLAIIGRSGDHLLGLINDVLELSKIEAGRLGLSPAPFDLHNILADLEGLFRLRAEVRHLSFTVRVGPGLPRYVVGDEGRLRQVLINLVSNALKFTHEGRVSVEADARAQGDHLRLRVAVADTGEGIGPSELEQLFRPFMQTESGRRSHEGTGLGLALSRQIARLMGGDISVTSARGVGSTFVVEVLVDPVAGPLEPPQARQVVGLVTAGRRYRALVAETHWQTRRLLVEWLHEAGVEAREAPDGAQALALWASWRPHLVLLDTQLPVIDGVEVARQIRESPGGRATVVIAMVGERSPALMAAGWDERLARPVRHDALLACVARLLGLDLRFAADARQDEEEPLTRAALQELPASTRAQLATAAATSDPAAVAVAISRVSEGWPGLGRRLNALADEFQFEMIELLASEG